MQCKPSQHAAVTDAPNELLADVHQGGLAKQRHNSGGNVACCSQQQLQCRLQERVRTRVVLPNSDTMEYAMRAPRPERMKPPDSQKAMAMSQGICGAGHS